jgi:pimeloyl-ACP methyl ester carboxylesterase
MASEPLHFDRAGSGEPLVLLHPLGADRGVWEPVIGLLCAQHDVIAMDMPGFGDSPELAPGLEATPAALAGPVAATLDSLGLGRAHVAGISLGAWVGLEFARTARALSATAICPAGFWSRPLGPRPETGRRAALAVVRAGAPLLRTRRGRELALRGVTRHPERVPADAARRLVRAYAHAPGFSRANAAMRSASFAGMEEIDVPVTLAWAEYDRLVRPPRRPPQGVRTILLPDCGHLPTWDDPGAVAAAILSTAALAQARSGAA